MENIFSFLKEDAPQKPVRSTRRQSLRQMKYSTAYQPNIRAVAKKTDPQALAALKKPFSTM
jgi:hypothetical protein